MNKLIEKWKINKSLLAKKMNMPLGTFCNKLSPKHTNNFSDAEIIQLKMVLKELRDDLSEGVEIDFNDALSVLINKTIVNVTVIPDIKPLKQIDKKGNKCNKKNCSGTYGELRQLDDLKGVVHCDKCNDEINRYAIK